MNEIIIKNIIYRDDLYPRFEPNQKIIDKYSQSIEYLPPIKINQNNILIDGFHRWKAHQLKQVEKINVEIIKTESEKELKKLAYKFNSNHGLQLNNKEKQKFAREMIGEMNVEEISQVISVSARTIRDWTENQRKNLEEERNKQIIDLYLQCYTQEQIAEKLDIDQSSIAKIMKNGNIAKNHILSNPLIYNVWNIQKQDNETSHFGAFPELFMENLLYYHTDIFDIIYDPFAGNGTTIDICKKMYRRFYCTDRIVKPGREENIKEWDIKNGLPDNLPKPKLVFLDPPYWKQAENKYSDSKNDLANMSLDKFYEIMTNLLTNIKRKNIEKIAIVISPTQYPNKNHEFEDHIFKFHNILINKYNIEMRYLLPYSTQQYNGTQVNIMKEEKKCISILRDLIIYKIK